MPRDISGNYTLPAGNPVVTGTTIASTWANTTLSDIATALTQSLSIDGSVTTAKIANSAVTPLKLAGFSSGTTGVIYATSNTAVTATLTPNLNGIQFPATQVPSGNPNMLDDYEEGSWTPTITFLTPGDLNVVYSTRLGTYTKVGGRVMLEQSVVCTTFTYTTASGQLQILGHPFNISGVVGSIAIGFSQGFSTGADTEMTGLFSSGGSGHLFYFCNRTTGGTSSLTTTQAPSGAAKQLYTSVTYQAS